MGIKNLNRFLLDNCSKKSIYKTHLRSFANKIVVIDTSIYMYKFMGDSTLMESMYLFISILKNYDMIPIFVFDGKPPPEKKELLHQRKIEKKEAERKYNEVRALLQDDDVPEEKKEEISIEMSYLKKQFLRLKDEDVKKIKRLMDGYGVCYFDAPGEADILCSYFVNSGKAWACISDDMDMFLYGCKRVIRHISLLNHTVVYYDTDGILADLKMSEEQFREIMILSGTDYNITTAVSLYETIQWFYQYNKHRLIEGNDELGFYEWLFAFTNYASDKEALVKIKRMFDVNNFTALDAYNVDIERKADMFTLKELLRNEGFIFV